MRSMVSTANGGRPPLAPGAGACGSISETSSAQGTTRFISSRNSRSRSLGLTLESALDQASFLHAVNVSYGVRGAEVVQALPRFAQWWESRDRPYISIQTNEITRPEKLDKNRGVAIFFILPPRPEGSWM